MYSTKYSTVYSTMISYKLVSYHQDFGVVDKQIIGIGDWGLRAGPNT